jgi:polysaccharide export outer membrane protein
MLFSSLFANDGIIQIEVIDTAKTPLNVKKKPVSISDVLNKIDNNDIVSFKKNMVYSKPSRMIFLDPIKYISNRQSLKLLYNQRNFKVPPKHLKRYGLTFFKNKEVSKLDVPVPDYYVLNKGDTLSIWLYGTVNKTLSLEIDKEGNVKIPTLGPIKVAGKTFGIVRKYLTNLLKNMYPNTNAIINLDTYSTIEVNLVGEVKAPGVYHINVLSTVKDLLLEANGTLESGSLRNIFVQRKGKIIANVDFYDFLKGSLKPNDIILHSGDIVFVPKAKKIVTIYGAVTHPAKYELKENETLKNLLEYAKGLKYSASKYGFYVKRYKDNFSTKILRIDYNQASNFKLNDGDQIYVYKIDKVYKESIYFLGNVVRPGERELPKDHSLKNLIQKEIKKFTLKGVFLKDTLFDYVLIKHHTKNLNIEVKRINFLNILQGKSDYKLSNNDEIYFLNKYNSNIKPYVKITGKTVSRPGKYGYYKGLKVVDLIRIAGSGPYEKIRVTTYDPKNLLPYTKFVDENYELKPFDHIELLDYYLFHKLKYYYLKGEVNLPGKYPLNKELLLSKAIDLAGGFSEKAYKEHVEVLRYFVKNNKRMRKIIDVNQNDFDKFKLKADDEITVFKIPNWDKQRVVTLKGEVKFPGNYIIEKGEKLSSVLKRAGGFTDKAFIEGALFTRLSLKRNEIKRMKDALMKLSQEITYISINDRSGESDKAKRSNPNLITLLQTLKEQVKNYKPIGRLVIHLNKDLNKFKNSEDDIILQDRDTLIVPSYNDTVMVFGEVLHPTTFVYKKELTISDYIDNAGGVTQNANKEMCYVIYPNGSAKKVDLDSMFRNSVKITAGSTIVIPMRVNTDTTANLLIWKDVTQIFYQIALTVASLSTAGLL